MIPDTKEIAVEVTTCCDYACVFCPHSTMMRRKETMSLQDFRFYLDKCLDADRQFEVVSFGGLGEPSLDRGLSEKIASVKAAGLKTVLYSTMSSVDQGRFAEFEQAGLDTLRISLCAIDAVRYGAVHGVRNEACFARVQQNLRLILQTPGRRTKIYLIFTLADADAEAAAAEIDEWRRRWESSADGVEVWRPHNWGGRYTLRERQQNKLKSCGRPFSGPVNLLVDGSITICCFDYEGRHIIGNLRQQSLSEIYDGPLFCRIIESHKTGDYPSDWVCHNCDQRNTDKSRELVYCNFGRERLATIGAVPYVEPNE